MLRWNSKRIIFSLLFFQNTIRTYLGLDQGLCLILGILGASKLISTWLTSQLHQIISTHVILSKYYIHIYIHKYHNHTATVIWTYMIDFDFSAVLRSISRYVDISWIYYTCLLWWVHRTTYISHCFFLKSSPHFNLVNVF